MAARLAILRGRVNDTRSCMARPSRDAWVACRALHRSPPHMPAPLPSVPWQLTGNHWLALPCIHPADAAIHAVGVLHRGARAAIGLGGDAGFVDGAGEALARPVVRVDGQPRALASEGLAWERAFG